MRPTVMLVGGLVLTAAAVAAGVIAGVLKEEMLFPCVYYFGWAAGIGVFGLSQVWFGALTSYSRKQPPRLFRDSLWENLLDGNLYIFSIGAAGTVLASSVGLLVSDFTAAQFDKTKGTLAVALIIAIVLLVVFATAMWTIFFKSTQEDIKRHGQQTTSVPNIFEIKVSIYCATAAILVAFLAEQLR